MTIIPDTPFDEHGWGDAVAEMIWLRKKVRSLELLLSGDSNDLNADSLPVTQDTLTDGGLSIGDITSIVNNVVVHNPTIRTYGFSVVNSTTQGVLAGNTTQLTFNTVLWDSDLAFSLTSSVFTIPADGIWLLTASANANQVAAGSSAQARLILRTTPRDFANEGQVNPIPGPPTILPLAVSAIMPLSAGQTVSAFLTNSSTQTDTVADRILAAYRIVATF